MVEILEKLGFRLLGFTQNSRYWRRNVIRPLSTGVLKEKRTEIGDDNFVVIELRVPRRRKGRVPESFLASTTNNPRTSKLTLESDGSASEPEQLYCDSLAIEEVVADTEMPSDMNFRRFVMEEL
ncbi:hypothetical protein Tco_0670402 [Tanacetum coccineum]